MSKVDPDFPKIFTYRTIIPIRITDVNYGGHVGNDTVLSLFHEARMQFLQHHHLSEMDFGGVGLIMRDVFIEFKKEIFYGDEIMVYVALSSFSRVGFDVFYKMVKGKEQTVAVIAKTGMICYNYASKKIVRVPEEMSKIFS